MELLREHWRLLRPVFAKYNGQEIKTIGDAFSGGIPERGAGTQCAIEIQRLLFERNSKTEPNRQIALRIGLHLEMSFTNKTTSSATAGQHRRAHSAPCRSGRHMHL